MDLETFGPASKNLALSDFIIEMVESNPNVQCMMLLMHAVDVEELSNTVTAKLPNRSLGKHRVLFWAPSLVVEH